MKKYLYPICSVIVVIIFLFFLVWINKANILAHFLSKEFPTKVTVERVGYTPGKWYINDLNLRNIPGSKHPSAFTVEKIEIDAKMSEVFGETMTIGKIDMLKNDIAIELYNKNGTSNNWSKLLYTPEEKKKSSHSSGKGTKKSSSKKYLIKNLTLRNITIHLTDSEGNTRILGPIKKLEFNNISDESGLPISELEDVIFQLILKSVIKQFSLENLFKLTDPQTLIPAIQKVFPKAAPFSTSE